MSFDKFGAGDDSIVYNDNTPLNDGAKSYKSFERLSHSQTNQDWDGYSFTEKIDPEEQGYANPETSAARAGWLSGFGALAALFAIAAIILTWIAYRRCDNWWWFWLRIATFVALIVAAAAAALAGGFKTNILSGKTENSFLTGFIYLSSAVLAIFFFVAGIFVILNKPFRFGCIQCGYQGPGGEWQGFLDKRSLDEGWNNDKKMQNWIAFLYFGLSLFFLFITFSMIAISKFLIELNRALIGLAGFLIVLFGIFAWYKNGQAATWNNSIPNSQWSQKDFTLIKWLIITTIIVAVLLLIFNVLKKRILYFILAILLLISAIFLVGACALHLRKLREANDPSKLSKDTCLRNLNLTHEDQINSTCKAGKYLAEGKTCLKSDSVYRWENTSALERRSLNSAACASASSGFYTPIFLTGFFGLLVFGFACLAIGSAFFLSDTSEFMEIYNKKVGLAEIAFLLLALLVIIFALIFIGRINTNSTKPYNEHPWAAKNRDARNGIITSDPDFKVVSDKLLANEETPDKNITYDATKMPKLTKGACTSGNCGFRVAILAKNAELIKKPTHPILLDNDSRYVFYPGCLNSDDDYIFIKGTDKEINSALTTLEYKSINFSPVSVFYTIEEVNLNSLDNKGLKSGEDTSNYIKPSITGAKCTDPAGFSAGTACTGNCKFSTSFNAQSGEVPIQGVIYALDTNKKPKIFNPLTNLDIKLIINDKEYKNANLQRNQATGVIQISAPVSSFNDYTGQILIKDTTNEYLPLVLDVSVPKIPGDTISIGNLVLLTKSGKGCYGLTGVDYNTCVGSASQKGNIKARVIDGTTDKPISDASVTLRESFSKVGGLLQQKKTDKDGYVTFDTYNYDYYKLDVDAEGYKFSPNKVYHDLPSTEEILYAFPNTKSPMSLLMKINDVSREFDLFLEMQSKNGKSCTVSSENKFCPYAEHMKDVQKGNMGYEWIEVQSMTESKYLLFAKEDFESYNSCQASATSSLVYNSHTSFAEFFAGKGHFQPIGTSNLKNFWALYCFTGFGNKSIKHVNLLLETRPTVSQYCDPLYPANSKYSLEKLSQQNAALE